MTFKEVVERGITDFEVRNEGGREGGKEGERDGQDRIET